MIILSDQISPIIAQHNEVGYEAIGRLIVKLLGYDVELDPQLKLIYSMMEGDQRRLLIANEEKRISDQLKNRRFYLKRTNKRLSDQQINSMLEKEIESGRYTKDNTEKEKYLAVLNGFQLLKTVYNGLQPISNVDNHSKQVSTAPYPILSSSTHISPRHNPTSKHNVQTGQGLSSQGQSPCEGEDLDPDLDPAAAAFLLKVGAPHRKVFIEFCDTLRDADDDQEKFTAGSYALFQRMVESGWRTKENRIIRSWKGYVAKSIANDREEGKFSVGESSVDVEESYTEFGDSSLSSDTWV